MQCVRRMATDCSAGRRCEEVQLGVRPSHFHLEEQQRKFEEEEVEEGLRENLLRERPL